MKILEIIIKGKNRKRSIFYSVLAFIILTSYVILYFTTDNVFNGGSKNNKNNLSKLTMDEKVEEFNYLVKVLKNDYPYLELNEEKSNFNLNDLESKYSKLIAETDDDINYEKVLVEFLSNFKQSNLFLINGDNYYLYKTYFNDYKNSPWLNALKDDDTVLRYKEYKDNTNLEKISSGLEMNIVVENKIAYMKITDFNPIFVKKDSEAISNFLNSIGDYSHLIIDIRENKGISIEYALENIVKPLAHNTLVLQSTILEKNENHSEFSNYYSSNSDIVMDKDFSKSSDLNQDNFSNFDLDKFPLYKNYNIRIEQNHKSKFNGKIYLLQNENTANAGDFLSQFSNITNFATTVGQFTKGNGVNLNDAFIKLPSSGFLLNMPIGMGVNEEFSINTEIGTYPEIKLNSNNDSLDYVIEMLN